MKQILLLALLFFGIESFSQNKIGKPFFTGDLSFSLAINENFTLNNDDDEPLIIPSALFFRTGFGYEFKKRLAISFNTGFDYHWNYAINAVPTFGAVKYNITENDGDTIFVEARYGKMWRLSSNYADGNYYGFGLGIQSEGNHRWNPVFRIDFHRKGILGFENNRLDSFSIGIGFAFY